jgi:biopolymer transport protein ExbB
MLMTTTAVAQVEAPATEAPTQAQQTAPIAPQAPAVAPPATAPTTQQTQPSAPEATPAAPASPSVTPIEQAATESSGPEARTDIPHNLSPWGMFMAADWVVKAVMIGLAIASLLTWTIWIAKTLELMGARTRAKRVLKIIQGAHTLPEALETTGSRGGPAALMLRAATEEVALSEAALDYAETGGVKERVSSVLSRIEAYSGRRMARGTGILASIGSVGPFVGLFGTVWGIMNSFIGISQSNTTNLAVVAPGIAEALLATALGLVAAIPAVIIYNAFARSVTGYRQLLADAAAGVERLVSRDLDFRKVPPGGRRPASMSLVAGE